MTSSELRAAYDEIRASHADGSIRRFRVKYHGQCSICSHRFRPPVEMAAKVAGKLVCWSCEQTALTPTVAEQKAAEEEASARARALADRIRAECGQVGCTADGR